MKVDFREEKTVCSANYSQKTNRDDATQQPFHSLAAGLWCRLLMNERMSKINPHTRAAVQNMLLAMF